MFKKEQKETLEEKREKLTEMNSLIKLLAKNNIPFEIRSIDMNGLIAPSVQICTPSVTAPVIDAISHMFSYGGSEGLIEIWSQYINEGDPVGYLTGEEAAELFITAYNRSLKEKEKEKAERAEEV